MHILIKIFSISLFLPLAKSQSCSLNKVEIICSEIGNVSFLIVDTLLTCTSSSTIVISIPETFVSSIVHSNESKVTNLTPIKALDFQHASAMKFIPDGIKAKFPNMKALRIFSSGLLSASKENLKQFGNSLEWLVLANNSLTYIDADLFEYNPNLKAIWLSKNHIRDIDDDFFTNLKILKTVTLIDISGRLHESNFRYFEGS